MNLQKLQSEAILVASENPKHPYGAVIADSSGRILASAVNDGKNPLRHAELLALSALFESDHSGIDPRDLTLVSTAEPCPMCSGAIFWADIGRVAYGSKIETLAKYGENQLKMKMEDILGMAEHPPEFFGGVLEAQCDALFEKAADLRADDA